MLLVDAYEKRYILFIQLTTIHAVCNATKTRPGTYTDLDVRAARETTSHGAAGCADVAPRQAWHTLAGSVVVPLSLGARRRGWHLLYTWPLAFIFICGRRGESKLAMARTGCSPSPSHPYRGRRCRRERESLHLVDKMRKESLVSERENSPRRAGHAPQQEGREGSEVDSK